MNNTTSLQSDKNRRFFNQHFFEILYVITCGCIFFYFSTTKEIIYAPDEVMRYQMPDYIFRNGALPSGYDTSLYSEWGLSYAFFPNFLGPILSSVFMKMMSIYSTGNYALLVAARFTSVLCGAVSTLFLFKICGKLFSDPAKWFITVLFSTTPQFIFMCTYVNNDIIALCGSAIICYAWILGLKNNWNYKNALLLSLGLIIVILSYYNAYGWMIGSIIIFIFSYILRNKDDKNYKQMLKLGIFIMVIVLAVCIGFFIRNAMLYDGDFLGLNTMMETSEQYAVPELKPSNRYTPYNRGMTLSEMLDTEEYTQLKWADLMSMSFVGVLGTLNVYLPEWIYNVYYTVYKICACGFACAVIQWIITKKSDYFSNLKITSVFYIMLIFQIILSVVLILNYSYYKDYQAQGRYCYPMYIALAVILGTGIDWFYSKLKRLNKYIPTVISASMSCFLIITVTFVYLTIYL